MEQFITDHQSAIIQFLVVLIIGFIVIKVIEKLVSHSTFNEKVDTAIGKFFIRLVKFMLYATYLIVLLSIAGVPMTTFVAMLSAIGLAVALALQGNLANFASALVILFFKPFEVGDFIECGGSMGSVKEIQLLFTHILTPDNKRVIIPNAQLVNNKVTNFSSEDTRRIDLVYSASYDHNVDEVIQILWDVVGSNVCVLHEPAPLVRLLNHGDHALEYDVKIWVNKENYWPVKYQMNEDVRRVFAEKSIKIPYPHREVLVTNTSSK